MQYLRIVIDGRVQGVGFRASTKAVADQLGIKGSIKNAGDQVLILATGSELAMESFLEWCQEGPDDAIVESVLSEETEPFEARNFEVLSR